MSDEIETDPSGEDSKFRRLTPLEFGKARRLWELGDHSLNELADMFNVHRNSLYERLKNSGAKKGSRVSEALDKLDQAVADEAEISAKRVAETKEQHYKYAEALSKMTMQVIVQATSEKRKIATTDGDLAALNKAAKTLEVLRKERYALLGIDRDGDDPNEIEEILIAEMTEDQIEQLRQAADRSNVDNSDGIEALLEDIDVVEEDFDEIDQ